MSDAEFWDRFIAEYGVFEYVRVRYVERRGRLDLPHCGDPRCGCPSERVIQNLVRSS